MLHLFDAKIVPIRGTHCHSFDFEKIQDKDDMIALVKEFWSSYKVNFPENKKTSSFHDMLNAFGGEENFTKLWNRVKDKELVHK